ncbi:hypothetical protein GOV04_02540 [Candidatus Woesearchaeota archaeon]|nr:hypothetical protein [Candidatus Woesearchaeota archaeon]
MTKNKCATQLPAKEYIKVVERATLMLQEGNLEQGLISIGEREDWAYFLFNPTNKVGAFYTTISSLHKEGLDCDALKVEKADMTIYSKRANLSQCPILEEIINSIREQHKERKV